MRFFFPLSLVYFGIVLNLSLVQAQTNSLNINADRLTTQLKKLSNFGMNEKGGNDRVAFSDYDIQARSYLSNYLKDLGLKVYTDAAGNLIAKSGGSQTRIRNRHGSRDVRRHRRGRSYCSGRVQSCVVPPGSAPTRPCSQEGAGHQGDCC